MVLNTKGFTTSFDETSPRAKQMSLKVIFVGKKTRQPPKIIIVDNSLNELKIIIFCAQLSHCFRRLVVDIYLAALRLGK